MVETESFLWCVRKHGIFSGECDDSLFTEYAGELFVSFRCLFDIFWKHGVKMAKHVPMELWYRIENFA